MDDYDDSGGDDDGDDIARFEKQCADRARAQGLLLTEDHHDQGGISDDEVPVHNDRASGGRGPAPRFAPGVDSDMRQKCELLQEKLARKDAELAQVRNDLELVRSNDSGPSGDVGGELKQRLLDLTKKNRRLQVNQETQQTRIKQLEAELKAPREKAKKKADDAASAQMAAALGDGLEDWKSKYLTASNKLQEVRHEAQDLRAQLHRHRKVLLKELGSEDALVTALQVVDDPDAAQWRGRAAQISQLQRQVKELKDQLRRANPDDDAVEAAAGGTPVQAARAKKFNDAGVAEKERAGLAQAAEKRREEFNRLQEEADRLRSEQAEAKRKREALKSRNDLLETQIRELRAHVQTLVNKSTNDDELVQALRSQLARGPSGAVAGGAGSDEAEKLRREKAELQNQLERQAQIVLQLRQKSLAASCENGSMPIGPDASTDKRSLIERVRYLEAENTKQNEQIRLYRGQEYRLGRPLSNGRGCNSDDECSTEFCPQDGAYYDEGGYDDMLQNDTPYLMKVHNGISGT
jgi:hypothetical protein